MRVKELKDRYIIRLDKGEEVIRSPKIFLKEKGVKSGFFFGIGAVGLVQLAYYNTDTKQYSNRKVKGPFEVSNLTGNVAVTDRILSHMPISL
ncbi:DUF296 domain-containing protein [Candidatus Woesearchaeota archaeon]|nr:DUF296 domain-containing protein [Candidatus Woesearchaeota archaeon]